jgi:ParB family chromosome partitioning protein
MSALLGESGPAVSETPQDSPSDGVRETPIELIRRNPDQPRRVFSAPELEELADSIRQKGVLQPLLVRPAPGAPGEFQIIAGERRWRAAQQAGLKALPVVVRSDLDDLDLLEIGIIENVQREDLKPLEEAQAYRSLMERFGRTQDEVAKTVGKSRSHVANALRLLSLPESVQVALDEGRMTAGHARAISASPDPERLGRLIVERDLSVRQAEALAREAQDAAGKAKPRKREDGAGKNPDTLALEQDLTQALGLRVVVDDNDGRGEIRIAYGSLEQLDDLCRRLGGFG